MTPRGKRALVGCGIGCGSLLLILIGSAIAFTVWIRQPGPPLEMDGLLADDTIGYLEWKLSKDDPATAGFLRALIEKTGEIPAKADAPLPAWIIDGISQYQVRRNEAAMDQILPVVAAWTLRPRADTGGEEQVFLLSLQNIGNRMRMVDWIMGMTFGSRKGPASVHEYGDETIYRIAGRSGRDMTFFIRDGAVYFTTDLESARGLVDRLASGAEGAGGSEALERLLASIPAGRPLRAAVSNESGAIPRILGKLSGPGHQPELSCEGLQSATLSGGFTGDRAFAVRVDFRYTGSAPPDGSAEALAGLVSAALEKWNLDAEITTTVEEGRVGLDLLIPDLLGEMNLAHPRGPS